MRGPKYVLWLVISTVAGLSLTVAAEDDAPVIRSHSAYILEVIDAGVAESATFRRLVETIREREGIVYVDVGTCQRRARSCLLLNMIAQLDRRFLFVNVDDKQPRSELVVSIAHELQHVTEILGNKNVRTGGAMYLFYRREGLQTRGIFETNAAVKTSVRVRRELIAHKKDSERARKPVTSPESVSAKNGQ